MRHEFEGIERSPKLLKSLIIRFDLALRLIVSTMELGRASRRTVWFGLERLRKAIESAFVSRKLEVEGEGRMRIEEDFQGGSCGCHCELQREPN